MARLSSFYIVNIFSLLRYLFNLLVFPFVVVVVVVYPVGSSRAEPQCRQISETFPQFDIDKIQCGYNYTVSWPFRSSLLTYMMHVKRLLKNCSPFVDVMVCSLFLPRCTEEIKGPYLPCRGVCYDYANDCKDVLEMKEMESTAALCDLLPEKDNPRTTKGYKERCFTPPNYRDSGRSK